MARRRSRPSLDLEAFVQQLIVKSGGKVRVIGDVLQLDLPQTLADELGLRPQHRLCFRLNEHPIETKEPVDFVAIGHPIVDRLLAYATRRGGAAKFLLPAAMDVQWLHHVVQADVDAPLSRIHCANAKMAVRKKQIVYQTEILFWFRVSLSADDRKELLMTVMIDPATEQVTRVVSLNRAVAVVDDRDDPDMQYRVSRLYRRCEEHLASRIPRVAAAFFRESETRKGLEQARIEEYYNGLMLEQLEPLRKVFRQMAVAKVRADLTRTATAEQKYHEDFSELRAHARQLEAIYEQKLAELLREKEHRLQELDDRYRPTAKVSLRQIALVLVPKVEWQLTFSGPIQRDVAVRYDVVRRKVDDWHCECCEHTLIGGAWLCACSSIVCADCFATCSVCHRTVCGECSAGRCHLCDAPVCADCPSACPASSTFFEFGDVKVCSRCRNESCPLCIRIGAYHLEGVG